MTSATKLLVVGPSWVGDMVMAQSLYRLLKSRNQATEIHVLAPPWSLPVLERMPQVARSMELPVGHGELAWRTRRSIGRTLRAEAYAQAIVLPRSLKAALVPFFARVPQRTGFLGEWRYGLINDVRRFDRARLNQTVLRFIALGLSLDEDSLPEWSPPSLAVDRNGFAALAARLRLELDRPVVAVMPGAEYGPAKRWPIASFAALAARLANEGVGVWVLGSKREAALAEEIRATVPAARNLCGSTTLAEVIDLLGHAVAAVTNDSGLMHIAAAVNTHVVAIYGSSTPEFTPPLTSRRTVLYDKLTCSPCFERECPLGHLDCLRGISVDRVFEAAAGAVAAKAPN